MQWVWKVRGAGEVGDGMFWGAGSTDNEVGEMPCFRYAILISVKLSETVSDPRALHQQKEDTSREWLIYFFYESWVGEYLLNKVV